MNGLVKPLTMVLGVVLTLVGIAGFFLAPEGMLLWFEVDTIHNVVHILSGVVALAVAGNPAYARLYLIVFGVVYGAVTLLGFTMGGDILGLFHANDADNYLHAAIAIICLAVGFGSSQKTNA